MALRAIGALLFTALLALFLAQPVLDSDNDGPRARPGRQPKVDASVPPAGQVARPPERKTTRRLVTKYPKQCLRRAEPVDADGLVAAYQDRIVSVVAIGGTRIGTVRDVAPSVRPPIQWSPSGQYLATGPQGLFWEPDGTRVLFANGEFSHGAVSTVPRGTWGWSPVADCTVSIESGGLFAASVDPLVTYTGAELVRQGVESFAFAPDGRALGIVIAESKRRSIWVADLIANKMTEVTRFPSPTCCVTLGGWTPDGAELLFWAASGASVSADGWLLQSVDPETRRVSSFTALRVRPEFLEHCAGDLLGIVGGDRFDVGPMRLAQLRAGSAPRYLTSANESHFGFSCTPNGALIATARGEVRDGSDQVGSASPTEVTILRRDGSEVITLTPAGANDAAPEWGPPGTGLIFVRLSDGDATVLFAAEGRTPTALGVSVSVPRSDYEWQQVLDWSATPPDGLPAS